MQTCKGLARLQQPHTEGQVQVGTEVGVETHRRGVEPHRGVHYLRCKQNMGIGRKKKIQPCSKQADAL